jgi:hypothetical protein
MMAGIFMIDDDQNGLYEQKRLSNQIEKIPLPIPEAGILPGEIKVAERRGSLLGMKFASVALGKAYLR